MSEINDENTLNEFEYTDEEKAELAKLDALNENSDELKTEADEEQVSLEDIKKEQEQGNQDLEVGDEFLDELLNPEDTAKQEQGGEGEPAEPKIEPEPEPEVEPEPLPDYQAQLDEAEQRLQESQGNIDDTLNKLRELAEQYDEGEISQGKYDVQKLELERELRRNERLYEKAEGELEQVSSEANNKISEYQDARRNAWRNELIEFLDDPANEVIGSNPHIAEQFDKLLASMGSSGVFEGLNNKQILQSVRNQLSFHVPELRDKPYTPKASKQNKPAKPRHENSNVPASLSQMNVKEVPADDPFAYIRKLSGVEYEQAISKLSEEQQDAFFFG
ncbi:hypothetical protein HX116_09745 [Acinetobacter towneri]|uniref:hypothetical protein n=1 Tax=Acinetobacter towneri TaxID=202956 RepID=UPI0025786F96|nr:hypothetical protein [Acinetobacter towneri]MDM1731433.1 hypothetical protein [Acinetobacter towneri]MDM1734096.1 hypothetical protein [Acinetobacter towneri]MDM1739381.1 hypothetical protein [Acinetobacter towneri]MDM1742173.1 hypothetical protein [Acinetobacter towneri]MDM1744696.1 hypothetical protein [Acinetobacter towneri]